MPPAPRTRTGVVLTALLLGAAVATVPRGGAAPARTAPAPPPPATVAGSVQVDGRLRTYLVRPPAGRPSGVLVLALPGFTETAEALRGSSGLDLVADRTGATVVYLSGWKDSWNAGTCCGRAVVERVDDRASVRAVADSVLAGRALDRRRVLVTGHSNGGMLALRLACERPTDYAGFFAVAGAAVVPTCAAVGSHVVLYQSRRDTVVPVAGRVLDALGGRLPPLAETLATVERGRTCSAGRPTRQGHLEVTTTRCADGGDVSLLLDDEGSHAWPGPPGALALQALQMLG